jgi:hypothetical protein
MPWGRDSRRSMPPWLRGLAVAATLGATLWLVARLPYSELDKFDKVSSIGGLLAGIVALWLSLRPTSARQVPLQDMPDPLDRAAVDLANAVKRQWEYEATVRGVHRPGALRVRWSSTGRPVAASASEILGEGLIGGRPIGLRLKGDTLGISEAFRKLPARQLVILGHPGSGKTVLALLLTLGLLKDRSNQNHDPIPALFSISSWDPSTQHLNIWLERRLAEEYPALADQERYGPHAVEQLVFSRRVIPILDGLDELPEGLRPRAIAELGEAVSDGWPLVVTCRTAEYEEAVSVLGAPLDRAAVVEMESVGITEAIRYLAAGRLAGRQRWLPLEAHIKADRSSMLTQALSTPLMVYLARVAYDHAVTDPMELCDRARFHDQASVENHLLDSLLPSLYRESSNSHPTNPRRKYSAKQAQQWLTFLAGHLDQRQTYDLAWWQLLLAVPHWRLLGRAVFGLLYGLAVALGVGVSFGPLPGLLAGTAYGVLIACVYGPQASTTPQRVNLEPQAIMQHVRENLMGGLIVGCTMGLVFGSVATVFRTPSLGITVGSVVTLVSSLLYGLVGGLRAPSGPLDAMDPSMSIRGDRGITLVYRVVIGLVFCLTIGLAFRPIFGTARSLILGVVGGMVFGILSRLAFRLAGRLVVFGNTVIGSAVGGAWMRFEIARLWLALTGRLPWRLIRFLDDAHRRGVLRREGPVYQFRHARLQDRLALASAPATSVASPM